MSTCVDGQVEIGCFSKGNGKKGQYVNVKITDCTSATLIGKEIN